MGLTSSSTVHAHLAVLQREGYLRRDPTKPRAIEVCYDPSSKVIMDSAPSGHVPLVGDVAAGTGVLAQENVEELYPLPEDFTGTGTLFMVTVRGDSMIDAGIMDGDFVVVRQQPQAEQGDVVVAGIPDGEATVKRFSTCDGRVVLDPANERLSPMEFDPPGTVYGKVVTAPGDSDPDSSTRSTRSCRSPTFSAPGRSDLDRAHVRIAVPGPGPGREHGLDGGLVCGRQRHLEGGDVLPPEPRRLVPGIGTTS